MDKIQNIDYNTSRIYFRNSTSMTDFLGLKYGTNNIFKLEYMYQLPKAQDIEAKTTEEERDDDWWKDIEANSMKNADSSPLFVGDRTNRPLLGEETASSPGADTQELERLSSQQLKEMLNEMLNKNKTNVSPSELDEQDGPGTFKT